MTTMPESSKTSEGVFIEVMTVKERKDESFGKYKNKSNKEDQSKKRRE